MTNTSVELLQDEKVGAEIQTNLVLQLHVTDHDSITELIARSTARDRDEYALNALRIGLLSLRHARGQIDADAVKREGEKLLSEINHSLVLHKTELNQTLASSLKEYFDPATGKFPERVERLLRQDGDLEKVLRRQIGPDSSELAKTLAKHIGEDSPLMKLLSPEESTGFLSVLRESIGEMLESERDAMLAEFSLDNDQGALSRLLEQLAEERGQLKADLAGQVAEVVGEFSLDNEDSALSRLVRRVEGAQQTITSEFSLDNEESSLSRLAAVVNRATEAIDNNLTLDDEDSALFRLKRELVGILERHERQVTSFQGEMKSALEAMKAKREESLRSTGHGLDFQALVLEFVQKESQRAGDIAIDTGDTPGAIKHCKKGDVVVELGPDCAAAGERFVVEAKEDASYTLSSAREEIEKARKNRNAGIGLFVFSKKTAPANLETLSRVGDDIFVTWDADDVNSDATLKAALLLAKGLSVRKARVLQTTAMDFKAIDASILEIESQAKRLGNIKTWTETMQSNSGKVLEEIRKMNGVLEQQVQALRDSIDGLKGLAQKRT
jgi:hypothetical protein